ncbi:MAG: response regulator transcription factor [Aquiluna sp.]|nr:response regulator transcription factor [Aquiluna sp.]MCF8545800.1 response regulator transcription factor [Aquiluna sp.]
MTNILVVEDAVRIASFIVKGLQAHGYSLTHVESGEEALRLLQAAQFDLVILDIGLPGIDGFEVLEQLRGSGNDVPVIVLTAKDSVDNTVASFEGGADDYMSKPFSFEELLARVRRRIKIPTDSNQETSLTHGNIELDLRTRRVHVDGKSHDLTAREFTMLEFFLRHPGQVLAREQILSRVWGFDHDPGSNVVDVYIRYLRQKLGNDSISTVRGMGYRLD